MQRLVFLQNTNKSCLRFFNQKQNLLGIMSSVLQIENQLLQQQNKILQDLCSEYSAKYKALIAKTNMIEMENKSLKHDLKHQSLINTKYNKLNVEHEILTELLNELQTEKDEIAIENTKLQTKYESLQNKANSQTNQIQRIMHNALEMENKLSETCMELNKLQSIYNQQNIKLENLQCELDIETMNQCMNKRVSSHSKRISGLKTIKLPISIQLTRSETPIYAEDRVSVSIVDTMNTMSSLHDELFPDLDQCGSSSIYSVSMHKQGIFLHVFICFFSSDLEAIYYSLHI